jgi:3-polyprenyl-4-hydroxybenzoate decarboxylase
VPELKTVLPDADFIIEGYVDPSSLRYDATSPLEKPKRSEGSFGNHTGY